MNRYLDTMVKIVDILKKDGYNISYETSTDGNDLIIGRNDEEIFMVKYNPYFK